MTLGAGSAGAQITLIPGPKFLVSRAPKFITSADFDEDGFADAAVTNNTTSSKISVLFGGPSGTFRGAADFPVGLKLAGIAAGDLNGDKNPDVAVADSDGDEVFRISGDGKGSFNTPEKWKVGLEPVDVAIGNFDGQNGNDLVTADSGVNSITMLLNIGTNRGFTPRRCILAIRSRFAGTEK